MIFRITIICFSQEVVFYEDGEPIIDGEPGDLKVSSFNIGLVIDLLHLLSTDSIHHVLGSFVSAQHPMISSDGKAMTCIQLSL